jgi:hypothetical protein
MTRREAKRMACALSADLLHVDGQQDGWLLARLEHLPEGDRRHVLDAVCDLVEELTRRGEGPPTPAP